MDSELGAFMWFIFCGVMFLIMCSFWICVFLAVIKFLCA